MVPCGRQGSKLNFLVDTANWGSKASWKGTKANFSFRRGKKEGNVLFNDAFNTFS